MKTTSLATRSGITRQGQKNLDKMSNFIMSNVGTILDGKYEIKREIARGGMGIVYEAYHKYTHKKVAIKVILADKVEPIQLKRFQKELEAYSLLSHPNVITIHDAGVYNNYPYIVMEYIEGVDICTYVKQQEEKNTPENSKNESGGQKGRDWGLCARLIYETALGLEYIHSQNMIHRDIKPANIIVRPNGSPVIIDLGLVKFNRSQSWNLTKSRELIGTIEYMPLEQAQGKRGQIDVRTDVYSLGLVLYELLTEQIAYSSKNIMEAYYKIMSYYPPLPRKINPQIPEVLEEITIHATEKQKEKRYASMTEFSNALKEYLSDTTVKPTPQYVQIKKRLWIERNKNKVITSCIAVLLAIVFVIIVSILGKQTISNTSQNESNISQNDNKLQNNENPKNATDNATKENPNFEKLPDLDKTSIENPEDQFQLGLMYYDGDGVEKDLKKAQEWYEKAANQGHADAQDRLGLIYYKKKDYDKAKEFFEKAATQNQSNSLYCLGIMYNFGYGVPKDYTKAFYYFNKTASRLSWSKYYLAGLYYNGYGVEWDYEKAKDLYQKSMKEEYLLAKFKLIHLENQEKQLLRKKDSIKTVMENITPDNRSAIISLQQLAFLNIPEAQYHLGVYYAQGIIFKKNIEKATILLTKAAQQGYKEAEEYLQNMKLFND